MFGFIAFCFFIGILYFIYALSPTFFWIGICIVGFLWTLVASDNSNNPNVGSHWSDGS